MIRPPWSSTKKDREADAPPATPAVRPEDYVGSDQEANERYVRSGFAAKAKNALSKLPMADEVVAAYFCMIDPTTPRWVKGVAAAALAYFILPVDAVLDVIPFVGLMDDASVLAGALTAISSFITDEHRRKAREWMRIEQIPAGSTSAETGSTG